jgi:hypothetical protein
MVVAVAVTVVVDKIHEGELEVTLIAAASVAPKYASISWRPELPEK